MDVIRSWAGVSGDAPTFARAVTQTEFLKLADCELFEFGAHTRTHPMLPHLSLERQKEEIVSSKRDLEELLGKPVPSFSYPNGKATEAAKRIVQETGFVYACTSLQDVVRPGCDLHELPRFWQKDVDGDQFLQSLRRWIRI
jgi:peptidoglycan/xylan/chitin deacetylase (PgdA/CDA1 family)